MKEEIALAVVPEVVGSKIEVNGVWAEKVHALEVLAKQFPVITSNDDCAAVNQLDTDTNKLSKLIESKRKEAKDPFLQIGKQIDEATKPLISRLDEVKKATGKSLLDYRREMERIAEEHRRKQEEEIRRQEEEAQRIAREKEIERRKTNAPIAPIQVVVPAPIVRTQVEVPKIAVRTRKVPTVRITNEDMIPVMIAMPNTQTIMLRPVDVWAVKMALQAGVNVPGAELYDEEVPVR